MCLVYEPMREPLWILQRRFVDRKLPLPIAKAYIYFLLVGLDYLHSECKVVHGGESLPPISGPILTVRPNLPVRSEAREYSHELRKRKHSYQLH